MFAFKICIYLLQQVQLKLQKKSADIALLNCTHSCWPLTIGGQARDTSPRLS